MITYIRLAGLGLGIAAAYYAGAAIGFALKLPAATPSVLWPPNAILTSALLLTPGRVWPFALLSALPAHIALETGAGWPMPLVLALFATNCSEALLAAGGLRWLSEAPTRFNSLRRVGIFLAVVVFAAPFLSSFLDAGVVSIFRGEPYWRVWTTRLFSNALTALMVVPAIVMVATSGRKWLTTAPRSQQVEAVAIGAAMLVVATFVLREPGPDPMQAALAERAGFAWLLPFILWAALRFGPAGSSLALLSGALVVVKAAVDSHGPFQGLSPADTTRALQVFLILVSVPLLVVAALVEERRLVQHDISTRLALEALLARLSSPFVQLPSNRMREVFTGSVRDIGESLGLGCVMLFEYGPDYALTRVASWSASCAEEVCEELTRQAVPLSTPLSFRSEPMRIGVAPGPQSPRTDGRAGAPESGLVIPLIADDNVFGVLACVLAPTLTPRESIGEELQLVARVLANALARKSTEDSLRASEAMKSAILSSLTYGVVVVDREGCIVTVNERWLQMIGNKAPAAATQVGENYLGFYRELSTDGELWAAEAAEGVAAVLEGKTGEFRLEYVRHRPEGDRTIAMRAVSLERADGGAVITHADLTKQRRAELEAQRARAELAHVSRVATMGALTASIAHQLNQPLTGILANAQAARRFLAAPSPDLSEARLSLDDIVEDDRRASEVIVRMREFLRKETAVTDEVDLNAVISDAARLVSSDAIIRNVTLVLQSDGGPTIVSGDRVQLQQVVLNLIVNAMEALGGRPARERRVIVRSTCRGHDYVEVAVIDNGDGFTGPEETVFEPLYTTKPAGMGLGLSIARSIVEGHAGSIRAANNPEGGATVTFRLPLDRRSTA